ncbi:MAG: hypothetical protein U0324_20790 [Polyangiales bacterium]
MSDKKKSPQKTRTKASKKRTRTTAAPEPTALVVTITAAVRAGWMGAARALPEASVGFTGPLAVLLGEAVDVARFAAQRWHPTLDAHTKVAVVPGLSSAVRADQPAAAFAATPTLHAGTGREILELHELTQRAQTTYLLSAASKSSDSPRVRAASRLVDLREAVASYLDDGVETDDDVRLERVRAAHAEDPETADALAGELVDYAALAEALLPGIQGYGDFDAAWIADARALAAALRARPDAPVTDETAAALAALDARNRLATLLAARMRLVRAKARFVFRAHPSLLREATSAYARRQRAAHRRQAKQPAPAPSPA